MTDLEKWIIQKGLTDKEFSEMIGIKLNSLRRYFRRDRRPSFKILEKINKITGGAITANDFYDVIIQHESESK